MNRDLLMKRVIVQLTNPKEILYAVTNHWLIVGLVFVVASAIVYVLVMTEPDLYEGKATLLLNYDASRVVEQRGGRVNPFEAEQEEIFRFFFSRVALLRGDSVMRKVAIEQRERHLSRHEVDEYDDTGVSDFDAFLNSLAEKCQSLLSFGEKDIPTGEEFEVQVAMDALKRRSKVTPDQQTSTVELRIYGPDRECVEEELRGWIGAYVERLAEIGTETRDMFVAPRKGFWEEQERVAKAALDEFRKKYPGVSEAQHQVILQEITQLQVAKSTLRGNISALLAPLESPSVDLYLRMIEDPTNGTNVRVERSTEYSRELGRLESEFRTALRRYEEDSYIVDGIRENITQLKDQRQRELRRAESSNKGDKDLQERTTPNERFKAIAAALEEERHQRIRQRAEEEERRREKEQELAVAIAEGMKKHSELELDLERLSVLEEAYQHARQTRERYELRILEESARLESQTSVEVQVRDKPQVSWTPYGRRKGLKLTLGVVGGLLMGIGFAFLIEILRAKVRFKSDIEGEFGVPVVAVIPRS